MTFSALLLEAVAKTLAPYGKPDLADRDTLLRSMVFVHHTMVASDNLLRSAYYKSEAGSALGKYFKRHMMEELGHKRWMERDLATAGIDIKTMPASKLAVQMAGSMYYRIFHEHPAALLGYMVVMECFPVPAGVMDELERIHGTELLRTVRYHATHDVDHGADVLEMIDQMPEELHPLLVRSAVQSAMYFGEAMHVIASMQGE
jgi:hypothetical protein